MTDYYLYNSCIVNILGIDVTKEYPYRIDGISSYEYQQHDSLHIIRNMKESRERQINTYPMGTMSTSGQDMSYYHKQKEEFIKNSDNQLFENIKPLWMKYSKNAEQLLKRYGLFEKYKKEHNIYFVLFQNEYNKNDFDKKKLYSINSLENRINTIKKNMSNIEEIIQNNINNQSNYDIGDEIEYNYFDNKIKKGVIKKICKNGKIYLIDEDKNNIVRESKYMIIKNNMLYENKKLDEVLQKIKSNIDLYNCYKKDYNYFTNVLLNRKEDEFTQTEIIDEKIICSFDVHTFIRSVYEFLMLNKKNFR